MKNKPLAIILFLIISVSCTAQPLVGPNPVDPCDFSNMSFSPNEMLVGTDLIQGFTFTPEGEHICKIPVMPIVRGSDTNGAKTKLNILPGQQPLEAESLEVTKGMVFLFSIRWINPCQPANGFPSLLLTSANGAKMELPSPITKLPACASEGQNLTVEVNGFMYPP